MARAQKITPFLWFDNQAEEAAAFYTSIFSKSKILNAVRHANGVSLVRFSLSGQEFTALNGGPKFKFNPSVSFFAACKTPAELKRVWQKLCEGGFVMMPLDRYPWSPQYGWVQDKYGLSWQVMLGSFGSTRQKFMPCFLFTGPQRGLGEAAVRFYSEAFSPSDIATITRYGPGAPGPEGTLQYAEFKLCGLTFSAMDNPQPDANYAFNEAISFVINCKGQKEVDYYWDKLISGGGEESQCAWLKDRFGISWQVVPDALPKLLGDPDPAVSQRAMANMLQMKKIVIRKLKSEPKKVSITVKTTVNAPVGHAWKCFTTPADIEQWNAASPDWHCPKAVNDLRPGGNFSYAMAARDGSFAFDFDGSYDEVLGNKRIKYTIADGRKVTVAFKAIGEKTEVEETFEAENTHPHAMQREGWQAILDNFGRHAGATK